MIPQQVLDKNDKYKQRRITDMFSATENIRENEPEEDNTPQESQDIEDSGPSTRYYLAI